MYLIHDNVEIAAYSFLSRFLLLCFLLCKSLQPSPQYFLLSGRLQWLFSVLNSLLRIFVELRKFSTDAENALLNFQKMHRSTLTLEPSFAPLFFCPSEVSQWYKTSAQVTNLPDWFFSWHMSTLFFFSVHGFVLIWRRWLLLLLRRGRLPECERVDAASARALLLHRLLLLLAAQSVELAHLGKEERRRRDSMETRLEWVVMLQVGVNHSIMIKK